MTAATMDIVLNRMDELECRVKWQKKGLIALVCVLGGLTAYVINFNRFWDPQTSVWPLFPEIVKADGMQTGYIQSSAVKFVDRDSAEALAYLTTWPIVDSKLEAAPPDQHALESHSPTAS